MWNNEWERDYEYSLVYREITGSVSYGRQFHDWFCVDQTALSGNQ